MSVSAQESAFMVEDREVLAAEARDRQLNCRIALPCSRLPTVDDKNHLMILRIRCGKSLMGNTDEKHGGESRGEGFGHPPSESPEPSVLPWQ